MQLGLAFPSNKTLTCAAKGINTQKYMNISIDVMLVISMYRSYNNTEVKIWKAFICHNENYRNWIAIE